MEDPSQAVFGDGVTPPADAAAKTDAGADPKADAKPADAAVDAKTEPGAKADDKPADKPAADAKPAGAPETYADFKMPEGFAMDAALLGEFAPTLKELNLTQEQAQKVMDFAPKLVQATAEKTAASLMDAYGLADRATWAEAVKADKEIGGERLPENLAMAKKAVDAYGDPELKTFLNKSGLGNHPALIRAFVKAGKPLMADTAGGGKQSPASRSSFYDKSSMNP